MSDQEVLSLLAAEQQEIRELCLADPCFFASKILDYDFFESLAPFHLEALRHELAERHLIFLAPRGHIKTTLLDIVGTMHYLLRHPDDRVLLAASTWDNAKLVLREITNHYKYNKKLHTFFPELKPENRDEEGNTEQFTLPCRTKARKEPSIDTSGPDRIVTGRHYELIRAVDLVVEQNVPPAGGFEQLQKVIDYFRKLPFLLDTTVERARITVDGTRWHLSDLYGVILEEPGFDYYERVIVGIEDDKEGNPIEVWSKVPQARLKQIRGVCLAYWWAANYMNDPIAESALGFRKEWFRSYDEMPMEVRDRLGLRVAITVDLAISERKGADRTAIVVTGISPQNDLYVLHVAVGQFTPYETLDRIFELDAVWKPEYIGVESVSWQKAMIYMANYEGRRRGNVLPIRSLMPDGNKARRASAVMLHAQVSGIYVRPLDHQQLIDECLRFTPAEDRGHDDIVDALAYRGQDLIAPVIEEFVFNKTLTSAPPTPSLTGDDLLRMCDEQLVRADRLPWELEEV